MTIIKRVMQVGSLLTKGSRRCDWHGKDLFVSRQHILWNHYCTASPLVVMGAGNLKIHLVDEAVDDAGTYFVCFVDAIER